MERNQEHLIKQNLLYRLQKKILFQSLHDLQSPLSAVSGYLELMQICSDGDKDFTKIDRYRQNIQSGIDEIDEIIKLIRYLEMKTSEDERSGDYDVSLNWFLGDLCYQVISYAESKSQKIVYEESVSERYLKKNISLVRLFLYNILIGMLKFMPKKGVIKISYEAINSGVAITFTGKEFVRSASRMLDEIISDKESMFSMHEEDNNALPVHTMDRVMKKLECSLSSESLDDTAVKISALFMGHSILLEKK